MYTKQEAARFRQEFWTTFGQYMAPVSSADGETINWVNYRTGEKYIAFRMEADNKKAVIAIVLSHKDPEIQQLYFEQFQQLKKIFLETVGENWNWQKHTLDPHGRLISMIGIEMTGLSIFKKQDWPELISFFKKNLMALDQFWSHVKYGFETLR